MLLLLFLLFTLIHTFTFFSFFLNIVHVLLSLAINHSYGNFSLVISASQYIYISWEIQVATPTFLIFNFLASSTSCEVHCCYFNYEQVHCFYSWISLGMNSSQASLQIPLITVAMFHDSSGTELAATQCPEISRSQRDPVSYGVFG